MVLWLKAIRAFAVTAPTTHRPTVAAYKEPLSEQSKKRCGRVVNHEQRRLPTLSAGMASGKRSPTLGWRDARHTMIEAPA